MTPIFYHQMCPHSWTKHTAVQNAKLCDSTLSCGIWVHPSSVCFVPLTFVWRFTRTAASTSQRMHQDERLRGKIQTELSKIYGFINAVSVTRTTTKQPPVQGSGIRDVPAKQTCLLLSLINHLWLPFSVPRLG